MKKYNRKNKLFLSNSDYVDQVLTPQVRHYLLSQINQINPRNDMNIFWGPIKNNPNILYLFVQSMAIDKLDELNVLLDDMITYIQKNKISGIIIAYWKQRFYNGTTWTTPQSFIVKPATKHLTTLPVVLLVSPLTASAAESFSLAMFALPQVKLFGENTMGIFSDQFPRKLPNGWWITLSNEKMLSADKKISYEKMGLPVAKATLFPFLSHLNENGDFGLNAAVNSIANDDLKN